MNIDKALANFSFQMKCEEVVTLAGEGWNAEVYAIDFCCQLLEQVRKGL